MKIVFMGTPEIARKSLLMLYEQGFDVTGVFTGDDKPRGRGMKLSPSPVKELALAHSTPVYHPADLSAETLRGLNCDAIAVVAFGKILKREILEMPKLGCINIHGSLLPKYRGAAPIQYAILNGETETGVTSQYMAEKMDAGDIIFTEKTVIEGSETSEDLFRRLGDIGARLLVKTLEAIGQGTAPRTAQDDAQATYAPMLTKEMAPIDFSSMTAFEIGCKVRAFIPFPVATMEHCGKTLKVYEVEPGCTGNGIEAECRDGAVTITRVKTPGGKVMGALEYLRGLR